MSKDLPQEFQRLISGVGFFPGQQWKRRRGPVQQCRRARRQFFCEKPSRASVRGSLSTRFSQLPAFGCVHSGKGVFGKEPFHLAAVISISDRGGAMRHHLNPRRRYTMMAALAAIAVVAGLLMWGRPWSPRLVERDDPAGKTVAIAAPVAPIAPETTR
jgi:hypothetical protein